MLSDTYAHIKSPLARKHTDKGKRYSDNQKLEAIKLWLLSGNLAATAVALKIPEITLRYWRRQDWWDRMVLDLRTEDDLKLSNKLKDIAAKALNITEDRLDNGDWVLNQKTGDLIRKPVSLKDAADVTTKFLKESFERDRRPVEEAKTQDILETLAKKFEQIAKTRRPVQVTDVILGEEYAVHDQGLPNMSAGQGSSDAEFSEQPSSPEHVSGMREEEISDVPEEQSVVFQRS